MELSQDRLKGSYNYPRILENCEKTGFLEASGYPSTNERMRMQMFNMQSTQTGSQFSLLHEPN